MMPRPSGGGKGPVFSLSPWMIDMTRSPGGTEFLVCGAPFLCEDGTQHTGLCCLAIPSGHADIPGCRSCLPDRVVR